MTGVEIQYFLGILGVLWGIAIVDKTITIDKFKLWGGVALIALAFFGAMLI